MSRAGGDWREPSLPEPFALTSAIFAALGWGLIGVPIAVAVAGFGHEAGGALRSVGVSGGAVYAAALCLGGLAFLFGLVGVTRVRSERLAIVASMAGVGLFLLLILLPIGVLVWNWYDCSSVGAPAPDHCRW